jgi:hypothetical protein
MTQQAKLVYKFLPYGHPEKAQKNSRDYFWRYTDGSLSEPLSMEERERFVRTDDGEEEDKFWNSRN